MKLVLKPVGIISASGVIYLLSTRNKAAFEALGASLVTGIGVFVIGAAVLLFRKLRSPGEEQVDDQ